jgi:hypothetical protein
LVELLSVTTVKPALETAFSGDGFQGFLIGLGSGGTAVVNGKLDFGVHLGHLTVCSGFLDLENT